MAENNFFIFGAGFTKAVFSNAPLNDDLFKELTDLNPQSQLNKIAGKCKTQNIEILLTKLDIDIQQNIITEEIRNDINREIAIFFQRFRFSPDILKKKKWLKKFACKSFVENDVILNLNYDCFLEGLLDYLGVWSPNKGYGIEGCINNILVDDSCVNDKNIQILKTHGSENFTWQPFKDKPESGRIIYEFNESIFPKSAANSFLGPRSILRPFDNVKQYIIAPSYVKIPVVQIVYLMLEAIKAVKNSNKMIIIGSSLRSEDNFLWLLLTNFLHDPKWETRKLIIVSPEANKLGDSVKKYWGVNLSDCLIEISSKLENAIDELIDLLKK